MFGPNFLKQRSSVVESHIFTCNSCTWIVPHGMHCMLPIGYNQSNFSPNFMLSAALTVFFTLATDPFFLS